MMFLCSGLKTNVSKFEIQYSTPQLHPTPLPFKSRHNMSLGVKAPGESKVEPLWRDRGEREGVAEYPTECDIFCFVEMRLSKPFFNSKIMLRHVTSRTLGNYDWDLGTP